MGKSKYGLALCAGALMIAALVADPALAKTCRDAAGKAIVCHSTLVTKGNHCVNLRTNERAKCGGPEAVPTVEAPVAGDKAKPPH
jgi:hypothetical protein